MLPPMHIQGYADKDTLTLKVHQDTVITDATNQCQSASSLFEKEWMLVEFQIGPSFLLVVRRRRKMET